MFDEKDERDIEQELNNSIETQEENVEINVKNKRKSFDDFKIKYKKNKKKYLIFMSALFAMLSMSMGSSYAYLTYVGQTANTVILDVGTLALTFQNEQNIISLTNAVPMSDEQGLLQDEEYSFDIKNNGTIPARYKITLDNICETGEGVDLCIPDEYVKVGIKEGTTEYKVVERNSNNEYIIETGSLQSNEKQNYKIKVWLAYNTPNTYNAIDNASIAYKGKLGLSYEQGEATKILYRALDGVDFLLQYMPIKAGTYNGYCLTLPGNNSFSSCISHVGFTTQKLCQEYIQSIGDAPYTCTAGTFTVAPGTITSNIDDITTNLYLKYIVDMDNIIKDIYVCLEFDSAEYCIKGGGKYNSTNDTWTSDNYESNVGILQEIFSSSYCEYHTNPNGYSCSLGGILIYVYENGTVLIGAGSAAIIENNMRQSASGTFNYGNWSNPFNYRGA